MTLPAPPEVSPVWGTPKCSTAECVRTGAAPWLLWAVRETQHTCAASITFNENMRQQLTGLLSQAAFSTLFSPLTCMTRLEVISGVTGMCEVKGQGRTSTLYCLFILETFYKNLKFAWRQSKHNKTWSWLKFMGSSHKDSSSPGSSQANRPSQQGWKRIRHLNLRSESEKSLRSYLWASLLLVKLHSTRVYLLLPQ